MLIMLVENNIDELRNLQRYVSECYTDSDIVTFSDSLFLPLYFGDCHKIF